MPRAPSLADSAVCQVRMPSNSPLFGNVELITEGAAFLVGRPTVAHVHADELASAHMADPSICGPAPIPFCENV